MVCGTHICETWAKVVTWVRLKFACMNLKKLAICSWKDSLFLHLFLLLYPKYCKMPGLA